MTFASVSNCFCLVELLVCKKKRKFSVAMVVLMVLCLSFLRFAVFLCVVY